VLPISRLKLGRWINHLGFTEAQERAEIRKARDSFARIIGRPVVGWFNRMPQTVATRGILAEGGFSMIPPR